MGRSVLAVMLPSQAVKKSPPLAVPDICSKIIRTKMTKSPWCVVFFHVTKDGSELPTAYASHKNAPNVRLFARTRSEMALTHCSLEMTKRSDSSLFPKQVLVG